MDTYNEKSSKKENPKATTFNVPITSQEVKDGYEKMPKLRKEFKAVSDELEKRVDDFTTPMDNATLPRYKQSRQELERRKKELSKKMKSLR